ncbi:MAG: hypothetical protein Fur005_40870 [Roseiflexaceae bacterium]
MQATQIATIATDLGLPPAGFRQYRSISRTTLVLRWLGCIGVILLGSLWLFETSTLIVTMLAGLAVMAAFLFGWRRRRSQQH